MTPTAAVIGGGPAGLMAAEVLAQGGVQVHVFDAMPSVGRKFLLAGKGGLNLTHSEPSDRFVARYGARQSQVARLLLHFDADALRQWVHALGIETFVGSSGRVFPRDMKAAPLLRAWLQRLRHPSVGAPAQLHMRHRWRGWVTRGESPLDVAAPAFVAADILASNNPGSTVLSSAASVSEVPALDGRSHALAFDTPQGRQVLQADVVVLALGGASWPQLGSDGAWVPLLVDQGVDVAPLAPANCGFEVAGGWSAHFAQRFCGQPFKSVVLRVPAVSPSTGLATEPAIDPLFERKGEFVVTATGIEGSLVYAASALLRDAIAARGSATVLIDLLPDFSAQRVAAQVAHPRGSRSLASHLKSRLGIDGIRSGLLHEVLSRVQMADHAVLAATLKAAPLLLTAARPVAEAISSAGGVRFEAMNHALMLTRCPGVFCAGEMLDWEAPTGGYLLTASMASGRVAGQGALDYLAAIDR